MRVIGFVCLVIAVGALGYIGGLLTDIPGAPDPGMPLDTPGGPLPPTPGQIALVVAAFAATVGLIAMITSVVAARWTSRRRK